MSDNPKVEISLKLIQKLDMTVQDFADLAVACADQAGMCLRDQKLFRELLTMSIENNKHMRGFR